jgi:hypothetical protein
MGLVHVHIQCTRLCLAHAVASRSAHTKCIYHVRQRYCARFNTSCRFGVATTHPHNISASIGCNTRCCWVFCNMWFSFVWLCAHVLLSREVSMLTCCCHVHDASNLSSCTFCCCVAATCSEGTTDHDGPIFVTTQPLHMPYDMKLAKGRYKPLCMCHKQATLHKSHQVTAVMHAQSGQGELLRQQQPRCLNRAVLLRPQDLSTCAHAV